MKNPWGWSHETQVVLPLPLTTLDSESSIRLPEALLSLPKFGLDSGTLIPNVC